MIQRWRALKNALVVQLKQHNTDKYFRGFDIDPNLKRGMASYAVIWPISSVVQEYLEHGTSLKDADWVRAMRFSIFGTFFMAPVFHSWMKFSSRFFKKKDLRTAIIRAAIEQVTYGPLALSYFFFGMTLLELKPLSVCAKEVRAKFWPTYKIAFFFWPTVQTLNFYYVPERNRMIFVSVASFVWTVFIAHMKQRKAEELIKDVEKESLPSLSEENVEKELAKEKN